MELETERLLMRRSREEDFEAYAEFRSQEETARFVGGYWVGMTLGVVSRRPSATGCYAATATGRSTSKRPVDL